MSRSYRAPWCVDGYKSRGGKRKEKNYANRKVRHTKDIPNDSGYRKVTESWDICDYRFPYNTNPRIYWKNGKQVISEPDPIWRAIRK